MNKFSLAVCGGTFDLFHAGHKAFIEDSLRLSEKVVLGITGDAYVNNFKNNLGIENFTVRKASVEQFLDTIGVKDRVAIIEINSAYDPYITTSPHYQAIVVTEQTEKVAKEINIQRQQNNVPALEMIISPLKKAEDGELISSTRIRNGEINRDGRLYINPAWQGKNLVLPESLRSALQKPWGEVFKEIPVGLDGEKTVVVGDATAEIFNKQKINQFLSIVDFLIHREKKFQKLPELGFDGEVVQTVTNPHAVLTPELFKAVRLAFDKKDRTVILIEGEDDLAVLPVLLAAPLGFSIFYGQPARLASPPASQAEQGGLGESVAGRPDEGLVQIIVTEDNKEKAYRLLQNFDKE